ncbi:40S ribosomal protein S3-3-like isoform X2 [Dioscorea cayenensis subsp. rotundata]|uniref:40S ribosomal protein S3-3-like isoform X2 n=1 Tax=Dioscorea cayennensis subsp. rotundata TaxID=55577 RepID=A0AB40C9S8_DIOCR|nr:40S ribosomal protein S3-3-like isoform X2 [Dioscorea cayenensis subsp. rotundata]
MATQMGKKRKFVADGVFFAELIEVLTRELADDGYSGVEVRVTPMRTEIIRATRTQNVLESLRYKLLGGPAVRRLLLVGSSGHSVQSQ